MDESAQPSERALAGLKSHKLNSLNGLLTLGAKPRNGHVAAQPVPVTRLDVIKAYAADCALPAEEARAADATASQIAQRFAPRQEAAPAADEDRLSAGPLAPPLLALAAGARTLAAALIAVALLPNLVLAGLLWYGGIEPRWPSASETRPEQAQASAIETQMPVIRSVVTTPIVLAAPMRDGASGSEVTSALPREAAAEPHMGPAEPITAALPDAADENQELAAAVPEEDGLRAPADPVPLPTRKPVPQSEENEAASFVKATAFVNLRSAPSSGASVVAVVAKGTKLRVVARKRGWVQATDPATSDTGWIYRGNVAAAH
jgi:hypothetical protein